jgi:hypothetical protein
MRSLLHLAASGIFVTALPLVCRAQTPPPAPNSDANYQALRNLTLGGEAVNVSNFDLRRDAGTFHLSSGTICFTTPVLGKFTGAVFTGDGSFTLEPFADAERKSLALLTRETQFKETFARLVLRFTDSTYDEIKKAGAPAANSCDSGALKDVQYATRHKLKTNLEARLLAELLSPNPRPYFAAFIQGKRYSGQELYEIDPDRGLDDVNFVTYDENRLGRWASFHATDEQIAHRTGRPIQIEHQKLDTTFEKKRPSFRQGCDHFRGSARRPERGCL